jgi:hypothetical protein
MPRTASVPATFEGELAYDLGWGIGHRAETVDRWAASAEWTAPARQ